MFVFVMLPCIYRLCVCIHMHVYIYICMYSHHSWHISNVSFCCTLFDKSCTVFLFALCIYYMHMSILLIVQHMCVGCANFTVFLFLCYYYIFFFCLSYICVVLLACHCFRIYVFVFVFFCVQFIVLLPCVCACAYILIV